jgi:hypothetical protein
MSSLKRIRSSRSNGARSTGPKTPEGKRRSSRNALRHGLLARCIVLSDESPEAFQTLVAEHLARFAPAGGVELGMVEEMAAALWRLRRAWTIETSAFSELASSPQFALLNRYESRLHCMYQRALRNLLLLLAVVPDGLEKGDEGPATDRGQLLPAPRPGPGAKLPCVQQPDITAKPHLYDVPNEPSAKSDTRRCPCFLTLIN